MDLDTGNNARLTYRIVGGGEHKQSQKISGTNNQTKYIEDITELFGIFPNSGWLYLRGTLDREMRDRYDITVLASDNGTPSATATTRVIINVLDANDNDPRFSRDLYEFTVEENLRRGAIVGVLQAKDLDLDVNAAIRYSLIPSNTSFQVNPVSGEFNLLHNIYIIISCWCCLYTRILFHWLKILNNVGKHTPFERNLKTKDFVIISDEPLYHFFKFSFFPLFF